MNLAKVVLAAAISAPIVAIGCSENPRPLKTIPKGALIVDVNKNGKLEAAEALNYYDHIQARRKSHKRADENNDERISLEEAKTVSKFFLDKTTITQKGIDRYKDFYKSISEEVLNMMKDGNGNFVESIPDPRKKD